MGIHPVHGLVLHQLSPNGRPVLYRAALSDMVVPYGDSDPMHSWKHVLDASEVCLGNFINSLKLGCDCLGEIHYFDINLINHQGKVRTVEHAICMHEEDYGIQWKHFDALLGVDARHPGAHAARQGHHLVPWPHGTRTNTVSENNGHLGASWKLHMPVCTLVGLAQGGLPACPHLS